MEFCLVYISSSNNLSADELHELLNKSQEKNRRLGITGVLLYCNGSIIQVLEGEQARVSSLYQVISGDPRHSQVMKLYSGNIEERSFLDWQMGYKTLTQNEMASLSEQLPFIENPYVSLPSGGVIMSILKTFYQNNHRN
jgi:acylphosphatase